MVYVDDWCCANCHKSLRGAGHTAASRRVCKELRAHYKDNPECAEENVGAYGTARVYI